jgi:hypothetical protein
VDTAPADITSSFSGNAFTKTPALVDMIGIYTVVFFQLVVGKIHASTYKSCVGR